VKKAQLYLMIFICADYKDNKLKRVDCYKAVGSFLVVYEYAGV